MENLEKIYDKLNELEKAIGQIIEKDSLKENLNNLKKEAQFNEKWKLWMMVYVLVLMAFMTWFTGAYHSIVSMAGISLITLGGCLMMHLFQKNTIDPTIFEETHSLDRLKDMIQEKLKKRMHYWALGMGIYMLSLTCGLHLMIFGLASLAGKGGMLGLFYGAMFGLTGYSIGAIYQFHGLRYKAILKEEKYLTNNLKGC